MTDEHAAVLTATELDVSPSFVRTAIPSYLEETYAWAYLRPWSLRIFDHTAVVSAILWGNFRRLQRAAFDEVRPGQSVLQAACVYGPFSADLAAHIGPDGKVDVVDVAPIQVENCARKLARYPFARVRVADAEAPGGGPYDTIVCFFLLHELPEVHKRRVVDSLLGRVAPGGRVVFIDYHAPRRFHPLKWVTQIVFRHLEPFASSLWRHEIASFATHPDRFQWRKATYFGGLFQKVVAESPVHRELPDHEVS